MTTPTQIPRKSRYDKSNNEETNSIENEINSQTITGSLKGITKRQKKIAQNRENEQKIQVMCVFC